MELRPVTFYALEGLLLLGGGPNLPEPHSLAGLLESLADMWARGVIYPDSAEAELLRSLGHLPPSSGPGNAIPTEGGTSLAHQVEQG